MMNRDVKPILAVAAVVAVVVVGVMALRPGTTETEYHPPVTLGEPGEIGPSGTPVAVVIGPK